jgi:hypothetical protein
VSFWTDLVVLRTAGVRLKKGSVEALDPEEPQLKLSLLLLGFIEKLDPVLIVGLVRGYDGVRFV